jgi:dolichol kinase
MQQISDSILLTIAGTSVGLFAFLSEISARKRIVPQWLSRKVLHTFSVGLCGLMPFLLKDLNALFWIVLAAEILLLVLVGRGILFKEDSGRKSWGIAFFPLPFLFLIWQFPMHPWLIAIPMIVLALSDSAAAIFGKLFAKK